MPTIKQRIFGPAKGEPPQKKPAPATVKQMVNLFNQMLAQRPRKPFMFVEGKSFGRIHVNFRAAGPSAAIAVWVRANEDGVKLDEKAMSVLLGSANGPAEKKAMLALRKMGKKLAYPAKLYDEIEKEQRPMIATIYFDRESMADSALAGAVEALAVAFLGSALAPQAKKR
jgi:hypothetical protein